MCAIALNVFRFLSISLFLTILFLHSILVACYWCSYDWLSAFQPFCPSLLTWVPLGSLIWWRPSNRLGPLAVVLVTHGQTHSENVKWKHCSISNSQVLNWTPFRVVRWNLRRPLWSRGGHESPLCPLYPCCQSLSSGPGYQIDCHGIVL